MKKSLVIISFFLSSAILFAQDANPVQATPAAKRMKAFEVRNELNQNSLLKNVKFRNVGPTVMSGRVTDIDVSPEDPTHFYISYASGGLWKTTNNGISFEPKFDNQPVMTIGDIAVDWKNGVIYAGTGEENSSRSSYAGNGIYKSTDDGETWITIGLEETHHIARILISPNNPSVLWAAAAGHLYSPNPERGIYKSTDAGKTWRRTLFVDENTGGIDIVVNPKNPKELYAAMWHRERRAWNFVESGKGSGIYKSVDGGESWNLISGSGSGFPHGEGVGRIGLALYSGESNIIYAMLDNQFHREKKEKEEYAVTKAVLENISKEDFLKLKEDDLNDFLDRQNFPQKYNAAEIFEWVKSDKIKPAALIEYLADANTLLFDTPVIGAEVYKSEDGGKTWSKTHEGYLDNVVYTYGYYFGEIAVSPLDPQKVYILGVPILRSTDGGKNWGGIGQSNVHGDFHALWVSPNRDGHLINGNDGGLNISYDDGKTWFKANTPAVGQFYSVNVDMAKPYNVYGGLQDNGVWMGPSNYSASYRWYASGRYPYKSIMGGDGMQVAVDTRDNKTVYTGYQFGNYYRVNTESGKSSYMTPKHELGERPYRWNWQAPVHISKHNMDIVYFGSNKLHRSMNQGNDWQTISGDLTKGGKKGDVPYGTLTTIDESPLKFGLLYTGSDDGLIYISKDGGVNWTKISGGLPQDFWVSRVSASNFDEATVYCSLNGYRWDNFDALIYKSTNYGETWSRIGEDLPAEPVNVIKEDPANPNILYAGTDHALYVSLNGGKLFMGMNNGLADAPVHDLVVQPREKDLVIGTHGRSIYIADVGYIEQLDSEMLGKALNLFETNSVRYSRRWGAKWGWSDYYEPETEFVFYAKSGGKVQLEIVDKSGFTAVEKEIDADAGLNFVSFNLAVDSAKAESYMENAKENSKEELKFPETDNGKTYLLPGEYKVVLKMNGAESGQRLKIDAERKRSRKKQKKTP